MSTPVAGTTHDITLENTANKLGFMIAPGSYRIERVDDFAPRIAQGTEAALREGIWDVWAQSGIVEGIDQLQFSNPQKIYHSDGNVFPLRDGNTQLDSVWRESDPLKTPTAPTMPDFTTGGTDYILIAIGTKVRRGNMTTGVWTDSTTTLGANCVWLHTHGGYVFAATGTGADFYRSNDLVTFTQPSAGQKATCFASWATAQKTYLVLGTGNTIKTSEDSGVTWAAAISVGDPTTLITGLAVAFGLLFIGKEDGLYYYDGTAVYEALQVKNQKYATNFRAIVMHSDGFMYTHVLGRVLKFSFSSGEVANMVDVTPLMLGSANKELYNHGLPVWMWSSPRDVYCLFDDGEGVYPELLSFNGLGWHQAYRGASGDNALAGGYSTLTGRTFLNDGDTMGRRHTILRDTPLQDYPVGGQFDTSFFDGGLPFMFKAFREVTVEARDISASGSISVFYTTDKGVTYTSLGTITVNGKTKLSFPSTAAVGAYTLGLRFQFNRNSATSTPVLERFSVTFLNRPTPIYGYTATLLLAPDQLLRDNTAETLTFVERYDFLHSIEASSNPTVLADMNGLVVNVFVTKTSVVKAAEKPMDGEAPDERQAQIVMVQAFPGGGWDSIYWDAFEWG